MPLRKYEVPCAKWLVQTNELRGENLFYNFRIQFADRLARTIEPQSDIMGKTGAAQQFYSNQVEEGYVEAQNTALQADVSNIKTNLADVKTDLRELRVDMKAANAAIAHLGVAMADQRTELKTEIVGFRMELKEDIASLRAEVKEEITNLRTELKGDIASLRTELKGDIASLRTEVKADVAGLRSEMNTEFGKIRTGMEKLRGSVRLSIATCTISQLVTAGAILGVVGKALKWF